MKINKLLSPIMIGSVEIANRCVMAPMGTSLYSPEETFPKRVIRYFEERAIGGVGLIIVPFAPVSKKLASTPSYAIYDDYFIDTHKELVESVHKHGSKIFLQLALSGGKWGSHEAPSSIYSPVYYERPRELTSEELDILVKFFIEGAIRAVKAGYDGVEVHGGHLYLIGEMISPATNKRIDKYGGTFEGRMKFAEDIINGILQNCPTLPIGFKFSAYEELPDGIDIALGKNIAKYILKLGVNYLHVSCATDELEVISKYSSVPTMYVERNNLASLSEGIKKECPETVVMSVGGITIPEEADELIRTEKCDMVVLGRALIAEPHWVKKCINDENITYCIRCNTCYAEAIIGNNLCCSVNPYVLHETEQYLPIPSNKKKILVIGAGPAGLRCAITAAKRGHDVTLYEKMPYIGGSMYLASKPKFKQDISFAINWFQRELRDSSIKLKLNTEATPEIIDKEVPDVLVIAIGAEILSPEVPGIDKPHIVSALDVFKDISKYNGKKAVVIGGGETGCETACYLSDNGFNVTIIEILPKLLGGNLTYNFTIKQRLLELLKEKKVEILTETKLNAFIDQGVEVILPNGKQWGLSADLVVLATGLKINKSLVNILSMKANEIYTIGDCVSVGHIREAVEQGERVGRWV